MKYLKVYENFNAKPEGFNIENVISSLQGTCKTITSVIGGLYGEEYDEDILDPDDLRYIDEEIFECEGCDWWYERNDESTETPGFCTDCASENESYIDKEIKIWINLSKSINESATSALIDRIRKYLKENLKNNDNIPDFIKHIFERVLKNKRLVILVIACLLNFNIDKNVIENSLIDASGISSVSAKEIVHKSINYTNSSTNLPEKTKGDIRDFLKSISSRESSNNWKSIADNNLYVGKYQFGNLALKDCGYNITVQDFIKNPNVFPEKEQDKAMIKLLKRNKEYLGDYLNKYDGKVINGIKITKSGMLAASHLVGHRKVKRFLETNGKVVPRDGNGVPCTQYLDKFGNYNVQI